MPPGSTSTVRIRFMQAVALLGALLVAAELVWLHVVESDRLATEAQEQYKHDTQIVPQRGSILDANRTLLATAEYLNDVEAAPNTLRGSGASAQAIASELAQIMGKPEETAHSSPGSAQPALRAAGKGGSAKRESTHRNAGTLRQGSRYLIERHALSHVPTGHARRSRRRLL